MVGNDQLSIPGLECLVKAKTNADTKQEIFHQELRSLCDRVLNLELEVSLLRILVEKGGSGFSRGDSNFV